MAEREQVVKVAVSIPISLIMDLVEAAGMEIQDQVAFDMTIRSKAFRERLGDDLIYCWTFSNEDHDCDQLQALEDLFEGNYGVVFKEKGSTQGDGT